jgi:glutaredoxin
MIKIFSIPNCLHCADAKRKLKERGIEFEELDAINNLEYLTSLNQYSLPVIMRDNVVVKLNDII